MKLAAHRLDGLAASLTTLALLLVSPSAVAQTIGLAPGAPADTFEMKTVAKGLSQPTDLAAAPDGRLIIVERLGDVVVLGKDRQPVREAPAHIAVSPQASDAKYGTEQGLLGVVLDPDFSANHTLYFYASLGSDPERKNQVVKTVLADDGTLGELVPLLKPEDPGLRGPWNHNGGGLAIYNRQLYIGVGDTGHNKSPPNNRLATCLNSPNGKILRINLDGSIPADNPLTLLQTVTGCTDWDQPLTPQPPDKRIFAWGVRNPFRFWIDPANGNLWLADVGENTREEVSLVHKGQHMGWPFEEGTKKFEARFQDFQPANSCQGITPAAACSPPVYDYPHVGNRKCIIGGPIASDGCQWPEAWRNKYFFGDETSGEVFTLDVTPDRAGVVPVAAGGAALFATVSGMSALRMGLDNALYIVEVTSGAVERIAPKGKTDVQCQPAGGGPGMATAGTSGAGAPSGSSAGAPNGGGASGAMTGGIANGGIANGVTPNTSVAGSAVAGASTAGAAANEDAPSAADASGCGCRAGGPRGPASSDVLVFFVLSLGVWRRRARRGLSA